MPPSQSLVLVGHGSQHDPAAATPIHQHADRIRECGTFEVVRVAFWKQQPALGEVIPTVDSETVYVVPMLSSEGYFAEQVFPAELGLTGDAGPSASEVRYTPPVGTHPALQEVIADRIEQTVPDGVAREDLGVAIVGHGTSRYERSADATVAHAERVRSANRYGQVAAVFLDQTPSLDSIDERFDESNLAVVPNFIGCGPHVREDIPNVVGIPLDSGPFGGPVTIGDHQVWYTEPTGTASALTRVVLERVEEAGGSVEDTLAMENSLTSAEAAFVDWLRSAVRDAAGERDIGPTGTAVDWGALAIAVRETGGRNRYTVGHHVDQDRPDGSLDRLDSPAEVRDCTGRDDADWFRPLRTAKTLPRGWRYETADPRSLVRAVQAVYPASISHWYRERNDTLTVTSFEDTVERQLGRYAELDQIEPAVLAASIEACCGHCVRERQWSADTPQQSETAGAFPCAAPCSFLLEAARTFMGEPDAGAGERADRTVDAGAFDQPGNLYRRRFDRAYRSITGDLREARP